MITTLSFADKSALFARISNLAYKTPDVGKEIFRGMGYTSTYYEKKGSNIYILENDTDIIIVPRGTEVKEWNDIRADLNIDLVNSRSGVGKVHRGFRNYTDKVWEFVVNSVRNTTKDVWLTGHSLGAAIATLMARRLVLDETLPTPKELYTYGSPRVGNRQYINQFNKLLVHHRWVNEGDIVTKVPFSPWYYHCGTKYHITDDGVIENAKKVNMFFRVIKNTLKLPKHIINTVTHDVKNHSSNLYVTNLLYWSIHLVGR